MRRIIGLAAPPLVLSMICGISAAGAAPASPPSAVPIEQEPAHRLVLQNDSVRVFEVLLPPGDATRWHVHLHDGVSVRLSDATIEDQPMAGPAETVRLRLGQVTFGATPIARTHRVRNVGETTFHIIYIELLSTSGVSADRTTSAALDPRVVLENDHMRALRRILAPGESTAMHTHASKGVGVPVTAGRLEISSPDGQSKTIDLKTGAAQWIEPGTTHRLKNVGETPIEIVDIELK